jgi:hypothetical protein
MYFSGSTEKTTVFPLAEITGDAENGGTVGNFRRSKHPSGFSDMRRFVVLFLSPLFPIDSYRVNPQIAGPDFIA